MAADADYITDDQIVSIAERLSGEGRAVTPMTVWQELRGGSMVEIAAALQRWRDARLPQAPAVPVSETLPPELSESALGVAHRLWAAAREEFGRLHGEHVSIANQRIDAARAERDEALGAFQHTEAQASAYQRQLNDLQGELSASSEAAARLRDDLSAANARAERNQALVGEMVQHASLQEEKLLAATASLDEQRRAHEALGAELARKNQDTARVVEEHRKAREHISRLTQDLEDKTNEGAQRLGASQAELERLRGELDIERDATASHVSEAMTIRNDLQRVNSELDSARARIDTLDHEKSAAQNETETLRHALSAAQGDSDITRQRISQLEEQLAARERGEAEAQIEATRFSQEIASTRERLTQLEQQLAERERGASEAQAEAARLAQDADASRERVAQLELQLAESERHAQATQAETAHLSQESVTARERIAELEQLVAGHEQGATDAHAEVTRLEHEAAAARDEADATRERAAHLEQQLAEHERRHVDSQSEIARLVQDASAAHEHKTQLEQQLSAHAQGATETQGELARLTQEASGSRERIAELEQQLAARTQGETSAQAELARLTQEADTAREHAAKLEQQLAERTQGESAAQAELAQLKQDAAAARDEANTARERATQLEQQLAERERSAAADKEAQHAQLVAAQTRSAANEEEIVGLQRQIANQAKTHAKSYDELRTNAEQWVTYAKDLKQRLDIANEKMVFIDARSTGEVALLRRLSSELERLKPDHELVFREAQQRLIGDKMTQQLAQKGYRYDPATAVMSKIEG